MGFGWAGAAVGANDAVQALNERRRREQVEQQQEKLAQAESEARMKVLMQQLGAAEASEKRATRDQQLQEAGATVQQLDAMGQGSEIAPDVASTLRGTPYGARVQDKSTLPSASPPMAVDAAPAAPGGTQAPRQIGEFLMARPQQNAGGRQYSTLAPTAAQAREAGDRSRFNDLLQTLTPDARNLATLEASGVRGLNLHDVEGADRHQAHVSREARENEERANRIAGHQHTLAVQRDDRNYNRDRQQATDNDRITQKDLLGLYRDATARATQEWRALAQQAGGVVTDESGNEITPEQLVERYIDDALSALEAFQESQPATGANGRKVLDISGLRQRIVTNPVVTDTADPRMRAARPTISLRPRQAPTQPTAGGQAITRAELRATAQRLGITEADAMQQAAARGLQVR